MLLSALLAGFAFQAQPIATYSLAGHDVPVTLPAGGEVPDSEPRVPFAGWNYFLDREGTPILKLKGRGGWTSVAELYNDAKGKWTPQTPVWHMKIVLFTHVDIEDRTSDGVLRQRRGVLGKKATDDALQDIGRFLVAAEAAADGAFRVKADVEVDDDQVFADDRGLAQAFIERTVKARTNSGGYEADDKVYRGPFQSTYILHAGLDPDVASMTIYGSPVTCFSVRRSASFEEADLPRHLLGALEVDAANRAQKQSSSRRDDRVLNYFLSDMQSVTPGVVAALTNTAAADEALPLKPVELGPNEHYQDEVRIGSCDSAPCLVAPSAFSDFITNSNPRIKPVARVASDYAPGIVFSLPTEYPKVVMEMLALKDKIEHPENLHAPILPYGWLITPTTNYATAIGSDANHPRTLAVTEMGDLRSGHGVLPTEGDAKGSVLKFEVKSTSKDPIAIDVMGSKGPIELVLGPVESWPMGGPVVEESRTLEFKPDGNWQTIQVDLADKAEPGSILVLAPPQSSLWLERHQIDPVQYTFANAQWAAKADGTVTSAASQSETDVYVRAKATTTAPVKALVPMLDDRSDMVALNAAARFQKLKSPEAEPSLIKLASGPNPRVSEEAMKALAFQETETAKGAIRNILDNSPYEHNRAAAAEVIAAWKSTLDAGAISRLLAASSWQVRLRATQLLAGLPGEVPKDILITFLNDVSPEVRLSTTELEDPKLELPCRRMLWSAVNDPSDAVRAASYIQLLNSPIAKYRQEGQKGVKDDSPWVRAQVQKALQKSPG